MLCGALLWLGCTQPTATAPDANSPDAAPLACDPFAARGAVPEIVVGPTQWQAAWLTQIARAQRSLRLAMYVLTIDAVEEALVEARQRGVDVQVLLDPDHEGNGGARARLQAGGVALRNAPSRFEYAHAKYLIVDDAAALVASGNLNATALTRERNYAYITRDGAEVAQIAAVFSADWNGATYAEPCTRLVLAPNNARSRLAALIASAQREVIVQAMYLTDTGLQEAVTAAAARGISVRVMLAPESDVPGNGATLAALRGRQIAVKVPNDFGLHAKLLVVDDTAFVGSANFSYTSLNKNRELGGFFTEPAAVATLRTQFMRDWDSGIDP